jgi:VanZ family protein
MGVQLQSSLRLGRWLAWLTYAALWTTALLVPIPVHPLTLGAAPADVKFAVAKGIHVVAYAFFAIVSGWLHAPARLRWLLLFAITAHGTATELLQTLTTTRTGTLRDVGLDNLGVALGLFVSWKWWVAADPAGRGPGQD